jgi:hypothetical protein
MYMREKVSYMVASGVAPHSAGMVPLR